MAHYIAYCLLLGLYSVRVLYSTGVGVVDNLVRHTPDTVPGLAKTRTRKTKTDPIKDESNSNAKTI